MPKLAKSLTFETINNAKADAVEQLLFDGGCPGLHLHVAKLTGNKTWRVRIPVNGKIKTKKIADYPKVSLKQARLLAGAVLHKGFNPEEEKPVTFSFRVVAVEWQEWCYLYKKPKPTHGTFKVHKSYLQNHLLPEFGDLEFYDVDRDMCTTFLRKIFKETEAGADKCRQILNMIFKYGKRNIKNAGERVDLEEIINYDDTKNDFVMPADILAEYGKCENIKSQLMKLASKLQHHIFLRSGEIISKLDEETDIRYGAEWKEIDFAKKLWTVPDFRMKMKRTHTVPLTSQVISLLRELHKITGKTSFLFPSPADDNEAMSRDDLSSTFREYNIPYDPHDCRTIAGDWMKQNGIDRDVVEMQLSHKLGGKVSQAYEQDPHLYALDKRLKAMQKWSDYLESRKKETEKEKLKAIKSVAGVDSIRPVKFA